MKVMVIGNGGREHAICLSLLKSKKIDKLFCLPGNAGISKIAQCVNIKPDDIEQIVEFGIKNKIDFAIIGPEVPLSLGVVDKLEHSGVKAFGPNKKCSMLEASKSFTKNFLNKHNIPTAKHIECHSVDELKKNLGIFSYPMVFKADGLAAGKGVLIAEDESSALTAIDDLMVNKKVGDAASKVVIEEFLSGTEASMLCFVDEHTIVPMESARDYKRIFDDDKGPNTGGMGTYSPSPFFSDETLKRRINDEILIPTLTGFQKDGLNFKGVLFIGLMITDAGPKVIEFNNRFGDPEAQSVLPRLETDLLDILLMTSENRLGDLMIEWKKEASVSIVLASKGYPSSSHKGDIITGLDNFKDSGFDSKNRYVFHAGTSFDSNGNVVTDGGRVLCLTVLSENIEEAKKIAYDSINLIDFDGKQFRKDIAK